jgi:hypothetical protein
MWSGCKRVARIRPAGDLGICTATWITNVPALVALGMTVVSSDVREHVMSGLQMIMLSILIIKHIG